MTSSKNVYEVRPRKDHRGDALPFGRLWYGEPDAISNAIDYVKFYSRSHDATICVYDDAGNVIETHEQAGDFREYPRHVTGRKSGGSCLLPPLVNPRHKPTSALALLSRRRNLVD